MNNEKQKAKELVTQFGINAKYVCLEVIEELKSHYTHKCYLPDVLEERIECWRSIKQEIEKL